MRKRRQKGMAYIRGKCSKPECDRKQRNKGFQKGRKIYGLYCDLHHKLKYYASSGFIQKQSIPNQKCQRCGWDKAPCDRHRLVPERGYIPENVLILCPNCHRLEETLKQAA